MSLATLEPITEQQLRSTTSETGRTCGFVRERWTAILLTPLLILIPCFWHRHIEAGDLGSHTYNAWLASLVEQGRAPGLFIVHPWTNIIVDSMLTGLGGTLGFSVAEKIVVCFCVLCFFWGAFAFVAASTRRAPWMLSPAIAMITYGFTFYAGFLNFYLSLGFGFFAAALSWRGTRRDWILASAFALLSLMAHPMGFALLAAVAAYIRLAEFASGKYRWFVFALGLLSLVALHFVLRVFRTESWLPLKFAARNGADQLMVFGAPYRYLALGALVFGSVAFIVAAVVDARRFRMLDRFRTPLELWVIFVFAVAMLPGTIWFPQYIAAASAIISRLTAVTAILGLCVLGVVRPRRWIFAGLTVLAAVFFAFEYRDTGILDGMERQVETLVAALPYGARVSYTIDFGNVARINSRHMVDRACIGRCFTYSNYEPGSGQFRLRILPQGSSVVSHSGLALEHGTYIVRAEDLPLWEIYQPDEDDLTKLAIRSLTVGERNGRLGHQHPS